MRRLLFFGLFLLFCVACKQQGVEDTTPEVSTLEINQKEWPKKIALDPKAKSVISNWKEFYALEGSFDALYKVENSEDLALVIDELELKQKALAKSVFPGEVDLPQIKGRLTLFNTFLLKTKGDLYYRLDVQASVLEMIDAYNALREQLNITMNNTLDTKLILEE